MCCRATLSETPSKDIFSHFATRHSAHARCSYKHHGIEPEKFNDTLDDLINSINRGDGAGVRGAANELADRTRDLEKRKALAAASQALKDQTKDLLAASAEALKNKDSDDAKSRLANLVSSMKANVADLAKQEEEANRRKQMLLRGKCPQAFVEESEVSCFNFVFQPLVDSEWPLTAWQAQPRRSARDLATRLPCRLKQRWTRRSKKIFASLAFFFCNGFFFQASQERASGN